MSTRTRFTTKRKRTSRSSRQRLPLFSMRTPSLYRLSFAFGPTPTDRDSRCCSIDDYDSDIVSKTRANPQGKEYDRTRDHGTLARADRSRCFFHLSRRRQIDEIVSRVQTEDPSLNLHRGRMESLSRDLASRRSGDRAPDRRVPRRSLWCLYRRRTSPAASAARARSADKAGNPTTTWRGGSTTFFLTVLFFQPTPVANTPYNRVAKAFMRQDYRSVFLRRVSSAVRLSDAVSPSALAKERDLYVPSTARCIA